MIGSKLIIAVAALALTVGVGGCEKKDAPKAVKTERVQVSKPVASAVTVEALDNRVSVLERKARGYDARIKAYDKAKAAGVQ